MRKVGVMLVAAALLSSPALAQSPQPDSKSATYQAKGEHDKSYVFPGTTDAIPYRVYVPTKWDRTTKLPLVILTHGANQPATAPFQRPMANPTLAKMAEERGFIVAAVTGYKASATGVGGWNVPYGMVQVPRAPRGGGAGAAAAPAAAGAPAATPGANAPAVPSAPAAAGGGRGPATAPPTQQDFERAELDILHVTDLMLQEYNADPNRVYLMGNSAGGSAVWNVAVKYPQRYTAVSPSAAPLVDDSFPYDKLGKLPVLVVHGDADTTMVFEASRAMVEHAKAKGAKVTFLPVAGGQHTDAWALPEVLRQTFDFYDTYRTKQN